MPQDVQAELTQKIAYTGTNAIYIGECTTGTATSSIGWRIKKLTYDGNNLVTDVKWAGGSPNFNSEWDERASYTYS